MGEMGVMGKMATYENAVDRLRDELAKKHDDPNIQFLGEYLTGRLSADHGLADKLAADGKSIDGALNAIRDYARKIQKNNRACVPDAKGFAIACEYYGIPKDGEKPHTQTSAHAQGPAKADDELDLDALLGGI